MKHLFFAFFVFQHNRRTDMTQQDFSSYRFSSGHEPSDEMLNQLMENAARKVRESNREADTRYFDALRRECDAVKAKASEPFSQQRPE